MSNPQSIQIHCDGAMDYDPKQTGGNGFIIEFPDFFEVEPIARSIRNDNQGIHRLEMISLIEAMEELLAFEKKNPGLLRKAASVELYTDRLRVTDGELINPYRIREWRKNGWKNHEEKPIKDRDLLDKIDKTRLKIGAVVGGSVSINWVPEKKNRRADKLSKAGKLSVTRGRKIIKKKDRRVTSRLYDGLEIAYSQLSEESILDVHLYAWEPVGKEFEACLEICSGDLEGNFLKVYINNEQKAQIHRGHFYIMEVGKVYRHHIRASWFEEGAPTISS